MGNITSYLSRSAHAYEPYGDVPGGGRWFIVTGPTAGLGYHTTRALYRKGAKVVMACRVYERGVLARNEIYKEPSSSGVLHVLQCDLSDPKSIVNFVDQLGDRPIAALINNAGVLCPPHLDTPWGYPLTLSVNHFGPFLLTHLLLNRLLDNVPTRIINLASPAEQLGREDFVDLLHGKKGEREGMTVYGSTKLFNLMLAKEWARRLNPKGVDCFACQPGIATTQLYDKYDHSLPDAQMLDKYTKVVYQSAEDGAIPEIHAATEPNLEGKGFAYLGPPYKAFFMIHQGNTMERSSANLLADDEEAATKLYNETFKIVAEKVPQIREHRMPEPKMPYSKTNMLTAADALNWPLMWEKMKQESAKREWQAAKAKQ